MRSSELAIIISYRTSASRIIVLLKTPTKYREFSPTLFLKIIDFQVVFNFDQTRTERPWYNGSCTMMAKPIRALELHYLTTQFLLNTVNALVERTSLSFYRILSLDIECGFFFLFVLALPDEVVRQDFLEEIQLMKAVGSHKNIVNMVGCCTVEEPMFLLVEYAPYGDLLHYLRKHRKTVFVYYFHLFKFRRSIMLFCGEGSGYSLS